jgi:iron complex transport system ATP-binding protein
MSGVLQAENVIVRHGGREILSRVSLALGEGELVGLVGPNGAGKTTLLRILANLLTPDSGQIHLDGRPLSAWRRRAFARQVGYLAQSTIVHWPLSVERIVTLGRLPHQDPLRRPSRDDARAVDAALARVDAAHLRDRVVSALSGGERARVMLARVLAGEPRILLADEPGAGLDPAHQLQVMGHMRRLARQGHGVVVVLHDLTLAARFCDRLVMLRDGQMVASGPVSQVLTQGHLDAVFRLRCLGGTHENEPLLVPWEVL